MLPKKSWRPRASLKNLQLRAQLLRAVREFFYQRNILEVSTPVMAPCTVTDIHLESFAVVAHAGEQLTDKNRHIGYLQTSPEYMMKRLLAAGSGAIYQISPAFRSEECGRYHEPEFSILEWYRPNYSWRALAAEVDQFLQAVFAADAMCYKSYYQVFMQYLQINPHLVGLAEMYAIAEQYGLENFSYLAAGDRDTALQILMAEIIEPALKLELSDKQPCCIYDFPATQAALARLQPSDIKGVKQVAARFEVYWRGVELANGFDELTCAAEQRMRFSQQQTLRKRRAQVVPAIDEALLAALEHGLPACSGVALGLDRLLMLYAGGSTIQELMAFPAGS